MSTGIESICTRIYRYSYRICTIHVYSKQKYVSSYSYSDSFSYSYHMCVCVMMIMADSGDMHMLIIIQNQSLPCSDNVPLQKRQDAIYCSSVGSSMQGSLFETVALVRVCAWRGGHTIQVMPNGSKGVKCLQPSAFQESVKWSKTNQDTLRYTETQ